MANQPQEASYALVPKGRSSLGTIRLRMEIRGAVQGVGFRPFVYRLARELELAGWVTNTGRGVLIEVEGLDANVRSFERRVRGESPPLSRITGSESAYLRVAHLGPFEIRPSAESGEQRTLILPDIAACRECIGEMRDPRDRRHRYPFINCTHCGPRYSIIEGAPYDRARTTMKGFQLCAECRSEYEDPGDRRFHAQPVACPQCGPHIEFWNAGGKVEARRDEALSEAARRIRDGAVIAVKGIGGFHLICNAADAASVARLRRRKEREEKPLAVMAPGLDWVERACEVSTDERRLLLSTEAPIVLLNRHMGSGLIADNVAPGNPVLGVMLPYAPLHHLLLEAAGVPLVATSGNRTDEPICTDEHDAVQRLQGIADMFLVHDRPIARHVDDSIVRFMAGRETILRRARGYVPWPVHVEADLKPVVGAGSQMKNAPAFARGHELFLIQHVGDLEHAAAASAFDRVIADAQNLLDLRPELCAVDAHPEYTATLRAAEWGLPIVSVQHHYAHVLSCMAENGIQPPVLGVAWDGTGFGTDGTLWGGEFLAVHDAAWERVGWLRPFRLPGGDAAACEPRRTALALLWEAYDGQLPGLSGTALEAALPEPERRVLLRMLERGVRAPFTSSAGRLFDGVAALLGIRMRSSFEGQAAMELEWAAGFDVAEPLPWALEKRDSTCVLDWRPAIRELWECGMNRPESAARFHATLEAMIVAAAEWAGIEQVVLTGGCFQNKRLTESSIKRLRRAGFQVCWHHRVPPNDGGLALGQVMAAHTRRRGPGGEPRIGCGESSETPLMLCLSVWH